jgi:hypothetical protein
MGFTDVQVQNFGTAHDVLIRLPAQKGVSSDAGQSERVLGGLKAQDPAVELRRVEFVGPQVGEELVHQRPEGTGHGGAGIMIYLAFRFEWKFAVAAIIANLHDVVIILGFFAFFQWEFSLAVLAAVLAVLGYSVNESVVIFDRDPRELPPLWQADHGGDHRQRDHQHHQPHHHHPRLDPDDGAVDAAVRRPHAALLRLALTIGICSASTRRCSCAAAVAMWLGVKREDLVKGSRVQDTVQQGLVEVVAKAYQGANAFLIANGVMEEIDLKSFVRRTGNAGGSGGNAGNAGNGGTGGSAASSSAPMDSGMSAGPHSAQRAGFGFEGHPQASVPGAAPATTGGSPLMIARQRAQNALLNLKRFVTARISGDAGGQAPMAGAEGRVTGGGSGTGGGGGGGGRREGHHRDRGPDVPEHPGRGTHSGRPVRVWFARLQMPVLRVALAEPEFFGTLQHPARQLIDRMGSCVLGFDAAAITGSALETEIKRVVQVIEQYPETGRRVFQLVYDEFQPSSPLPDQKGTTQRW